MKARGRWDGRVRSLCCLVMLASTACSLGVLDNLQDESAPDDAGTSSPPDHDAMVPSHCGDDLQNEGESAADCGGATSCDRCEAGKSCADPSDCKSVNCVDMVCAEASCSDEVRNQGEQYVDCGGPCPACAPCANGMMDQGEADIDCGHTCGAPCITGSSCLDEDDCASARCVDAQCRAGTRGGYWAASDWIGTVQAPNQLPWADLSQVYVGYVGVNPALECAFWSDAEQKDDADAAALENAQELIAYRNMMAKGVQVLLSVGGPLLSYRLSAAASEPNREKFASSCVKLMKELGADGIDLDWRFPTRFAGPATGPGACRDEDGCASKDDAANLTALLGELRRQFAVKDVPGKLLTVVLRANRKDDAANAPYDYESLFGPSPRLLDWATVASYDFHTSSEPTVEFGAPFADVTAAMSFAREQVRSTAARSLFVGLSLSGPQWSGVSAPDDTGVGNAGTSAGAVTYDAVKGYLTDHPACKPYSPLAGSTRNRYVYCAGALGSLQDVWVGADDASVLANKARSALTGGHAGVSLWFLGQDGAESEAIHAVAQEMDTQQPLDDAPFSLPARVEAEDYDSGGELVAYHDTSAGNTAGAYRFDDVDVEACSDRGHGFDVSSFVGGEWLEYTLVPQAGSDYNIEFRVAATHDAGALHVDEENNRVTQTVAVPNTAGAQKWTTLEQNALALQNREQTLRVVADSGQFSLNWVRFTRGQAPYLDTPFAIPGTIELEFYDVGGPNVAYFDQSGNTYTRERTGPVLIDANSDALSGLHVSDIQAGEWLEYTVNVAQAGKHNVELRVAASAAHSVHITNAAGTNLSGIIKVPDIGEKDEWLTVEGRTALTLPAGQQVLGVAIDTVGSGVFNFNWLRFTRGQVPYSGTPAVIPGTIQAESFDLGGAEEAYHDETQGNSYVEYRYTDVDIERSTDDGGGFDVTTVATDDWTEYTVNVLETGDYSFEVRASSFQGMASLHIEVDGVNAGTVNIDKTDGAWKTFKTSGVALTSGQHVLRVAYDTPRASYNWFKFTRSP